MDGIRYGVVGDHETLTKIELMNRLGITNPRTMDRRLDELGIVPYAAGTQSPQISGYVYNMAVREECMRLRIERRGKSATEEEASS